MGLLWQTLMTGLWTGSASTAEGRPGERGFTADTATSVDVAGSIGANAHAQARAEDVGPSSQHVVTGKGLIGVSQQQDVNTPPDTAGQAEPDTTTPPAHKRPIKTVTTIFTASIYDNFYLIQTKGYNDHEPQLDSTPSLRHDRTHEKQ